MSYICAEYKHNINKVITWERDVDGFRFIKYHKAPHYFYVPDSQGEYFSTRGERLEKLTFKNEYLYKKGLENNPINFEGDFNPVERVLMDKYYKTRIPDLHFTLLDIEVDYSSIRGWSRPEDPYAPINAITLYHLWNKEYITFVVPPQGWDKTPFSEDDEILNKSKIVFCKNEKQLLLLTLEAILDSDVLSGWNSEMFDLPYLLKRTGIALGESYIKRWCFPEAKNPYWKEVQQYGKMNITVDIYGRCHLDYLRLFKKFTFEGRPSFSLENIAKDELEDIPKLEYPGTLEELYHNDFELFTKYNIRDVEVIEKLEEKFKFLELANGMMHANTVGTNAVLGSVAIIDTGIINNCHYERNEIVDNRTNNPDVHIEGAMVFTPRTGLWKCIGSIDIKSLYPSTYRALNISPDTLIGQFDDDEKDWQGIISADNMIHTLRLDSNEVLELTGKEWKQYFKDNNMSLSAYGTAFDLSKQGFIPAIFEKWYEERIELKAELSKWKKITKKLVQQNKQDSIEYKEALKKVEYYDLQQLIKKVLLNSGYGATLNQWCRFHDHRLGSSTTYTGKRITRFMANTAGELLTNEPSKFIVDEEELPDGKIRKTYYCTSKAILAGDTDSCYFKIADDYTSKEQAIKIADSISNLVNAEFPKFMEDNFFCTKSFKNLIECEREVVASTGIFLARKRYVLKCINIDGYDIEPGSKKEIKAMGIETKKSDTPKYIQGFLKEMLIKILNGQEYEDLEEFILNFRTEFRSQKNQFLFGITRSVNKLNMYQEEQDIWEIDKASKRPRLPGHVRATINHNKYIIDNNENDTMSIQDGQKVSIFYLKFNDDKFKSIAMSADDNEFPDWFVKEFDIDMKLTEDKLIDKKINKIFEVINWEIPNEIKTLVDSILEF